MSKPKDETIVRGCIGQVSLRGAGSGSRSTSQKLNPTASFKRALILFSCHGPILLIAVTTNQMSRSGFTTAILLRHSRNEPNQSTAYTTVIFSIIFRSRLDNESCQALETIFRPGRHWRSWRMIRPFHQHVGVLLLIDPVTSETRKKSESRSDVWVVSRYLEPSLVRWCEIGVYWTYPYIYLIVPYLSNTIFLVYSEP